MANCYYSESKKTQALFHYDYISAKPNNNYYIEALKYAGEITYDAKDFKKSLAYFSILEDVSIDQEDLSISKKGQFYCFHYLDNPNSTIKYAKKIAKDKLEHVLTGKGKHKNIQKRKFCSLLDD